MKYDFKKAILLGINSESYSFSNFSMEIEVTKNNESKWTNYYQKPNDKSFSHGGRLEMICGRFHSICSS